MESLKNIFELTSISRWLGRENEENVRLGLGIVVVGLPPVVREGKRKRNWSEIIHDSNPGDLLSINGFTNLS